MPNEYYERLGDSVPFTVFTLVFPEILAGTSAEIEIEVPGSEAGVAVYASPQGDLGNVSLLWCARATRDGFAAIRVCNPTAAPITPTATNWRGVVTLGQGWRR